jgi:hypothetical protein
VTGKDDMDHVEEVPDFGPDEDILTTEIREGETGDGAPL